MRKHTKKSIVIVVLVVLLLAVTVSVASASGGTHHRVHYGDTLSSIGRYYGVNPHHIARANGLQNPNYIYAGQVLYIPSGYSQPWHGKDNYYPNRGWDNCSSARCGGGYDGQYGQGYGYHHAPQQGYGYDYAGYYYYQRYPNYRQYNYTCGYYHNCY